MTDRTTGARLVALSFGANDPLRLARFWAAALRWDVGTAAPNGEVDLVPTDGTRFGLRFRPVAEERSGLGRLHLDLTTTSPDDQTGTVAALLELGARHLDVGQRPEEKHVVLADPEGNEFCIIEPENAFLAGTGRLGAINCDGSPQVGYFWSAALGWPLVWDQNEETAIRAPDGAGPFITWGGPPVAPKNGRNRLHLDLAPSAGADQRSLLDQLADLGARLVDPDSGDGDEVAMLDPEDNEFCVLSPEDAGARASS